VVSQAKMLRTIEVFKTFINDLNQLVQQGPVNRRRVLQVHPRPSYMFSL